MNHQWHFWCIDNGGKHQSFVLMAKDKETAIKKGMNRAKLHAAGSITNWHCALQLGMWV